jgi:TetR/AcrR family transcriptional regulator, repressor of the ameABC operon
MHQADVLFRQFGASKTTVADIAHELDMSPANIYKFFPSKNAIIQAGADRKLGQIKEILTRVAQSKKGAADRILGVILSIYEFHREHFRHERQLYKLVIAATEENWSCVRAFREFLTQILHDLLEEGVRTREFQRMNTGATTQILLDCFTWITNPILFQELNPNEVKDRARAQVHLLKKAFR